MARGPTSHRAAPTRAPQTCRNDASRPQKFRQPRHSLIGRGAHILGVDPGCEQMNPSQLKRVKFFDVEGDAARAFLSTVTVDSDEVMRLFVEAVLKAYDDEL